MDLLNALSTVKLAYDAGAQLAQANDAHASRTPSVHRTPSRMLGTASLVGVFHGP